MRRIPLVFLAALLGANYGGGGRGGGNGGGPAPAANTGGPQAPLPREDVPPPPIEPVGHETKPAPEAVESAAEPAADPPPKAMSLEDAAENFTTVVESFVARQSQDGVWAFKEKGRAVPLTLQGVDARSVRDLGKGRYSGNANLRDLKTKRKRVLEFVVDLSGSAWKVASFRPAPVKP